MVVLFFIILVLIVILAAVLEPVFGFGHDVAGYTAFAFVGGAFIAMFYFYLFTRKGRAIVRVWNIQEIRKRRIVREFNEMSRRINKKYYKKLDRQTAREIDRMCDGRERPTNGVLWVPPFTGGNHGGDGGNCGDCGAF